jgi:hypothetical protein
VVWIGNSGNLIEMQIYSFISGKQHKRRLTEINCTTLIRLEMPLMKSSTMTGEQAIDAYSHNELQEIQDWAMQNAIDKDPAVAAQMIRQKMQPFISLAYRDKKCT